MSPIVSQCLDWYSRVHAVAFNTMRNRNFDMFHHSLDDFSLPAKVISFDLPLSYNTINFLNVCYAYVVVYLT